MLEEVIKANWSQNQANEALKCVNQGPNPKRNKKTLCDFFPTFLSLGEQSYSILILVRGSRHPMEQPNRGVHKLTQISPIEKI